MTCNFPAGGGHHPILVKYYGHILIIYLSTTGQILPPQAAGIIHSDIERGFIKAETIGYQARSDLSNAGQILIK